MLTYLHRLRSTISLADYVLDFLRDSFRKSYCPALILDRITKARVSELPHHSRRDSTRIGDRLGFLPSWKHEIKM